MMILSSSLFLFFFVASIVSSSYQELSLLRLPERSASLFFTCLFSSVALGTSSPFFYVDLSDSVALLSVRETFRFFSPSRLHS